MNNISAETIAYFLGAGLISVLTTISGFTFGDLYRRLRKVEVSRDDADKKIIAMEIQLSHCAENLKSMAISMQELTRVKLLAEIELLQKTK